MELPVIWDAVAFIQHHCNVNQLQIFSEIDCQLWDELSCSLSLFYFISVKNADNCQQINDHTICIKRTTDSVMATVDLSLTVCSCDTLWMCCTWDGSNDMPSETHDISILSGLQETTGLCCVLTMNLIVLNIFVDRRISLTNDQQAFVYHDFTIYRG